MKAHVHAHAQAHADPNSNSHAPPLSAAPASASAKAAATAATGLLSLPYLYSPSGQPRFTLPSLLSWHAARNPTCAFRVDRATATATGSGEDEWRTTTFKEFRELVHGCAHLLAERLKLRSPVPARPSQSVSPEGAARPTTATASPVPARAVLVTLHRDDTPASSACTFAAMTLGWAVLPLSPRLPPRTAAEMLRGVGGGVGAVVFCEREAGTEAEGAGEMQHLAEEITRAMSLSPRERLQVMRMPSVGEMREAWSTRGEWRSDDTDAYADADTLGQLELDSVCLILHSSGR